VDWLGRQDVRIVIHEAPSWNPAEVICVKALRKLLTFHWLADQAINEGVACALGKVIPGHKEYSSHPA